MSENQKAPLTTHPLADVADVGGDRKSTDVDATEDDVGPSAAPTDEAHAPEPKPKPEPKRLKRTAGNAANQNGGAVAGFMWIAIVLGVSCVAACVTVLILPEPDSVGGSLVSAPPGVINHHEKGVFIKVPVKPRVDIKIFVKDEGNKYARETILLLHGWGSSSYIWRKLTPMLASNGFRVITFDLPGCGLSDKPVEGDLSTEVLVKQIARLSGILQMQPVHLVVHDTAGVLGAEYTIHNPEKVRSFHIMDAPMSASASSTLPLWMSNVPGVSQIIGNLPAPLLKFYLNKCCAHSISASDAEAHAFLAVYNGGMASLKARLAHIDSSAAQTRRIWERLLN
eukprot:6665422-Pyramimonas_sp.AAC.1